MSLNKFLCKHFDKEKKGYVTIGDFFGGIQPYLFVGTIGLILFSFFGIMLAQTQNIPPDNTDTVYGFFAFLIKAWTIPLGIIFAFIVGIYILIKISKIKIAKCELKEKNNNE